ncbi:MAG: hypothetical protein QOF65_69 [Thermoleophilaceae bacterium]|nr:hypothetical protein [Thermoleophilaceae bacterium]
MWATAVLVLALLALAAPASAAPGFRVGFGSSNVTPPLFGQAPAPESSGTVPCLPGLNGPRVFAFEEPYIDTSGDGRFNYPEQYCDANNNGRYDGIYSSGGVDSLATRVHDPIDARAIAIGDGSKTIVYVSVVAQGLFQNYTKQMRDQAVATSKTPGHTPIDDVVVSANHNESSPDTIGIYGGPETPAGTGGNSGIDDYYMAFLRGKVAEAAVAAADAAQPATLHAHQFTLPPNLRVALSKNFPTTDDLGQPAAIDPKVGLLQARGADGKPIVTVMSLAAHNQEVGHSNTHGSDNQVDMSSDWPGYFAARLEAQLGGKAMFLVGDNGSEEDPVTVPALPNNGNDPYPQAKATGEALADALAAQLPNARALRFGTLDFRRSEFTVPLENNAFKAAAAAGLFGDRQTYEAGQPAGRGGSDLLTEVSALRVGPDLQLLDNPAEAFPGLMVGTPFGIEDAPCPSRPNPPVPTWNATAAYRFQVGLANDMIGYISPPWAFTDVAGIYAAPPECQNDPNTDRDSKGHQHKLETEGVGPTAGGLVADNLTGMLKQQGADPTAVMKPGRFVYADGTLGRSPHNAVGAWVAGDSASAPGTIVALPGVTGFGGRGADATGRAMDYDGAEQPGQGDVTTRGMLVYACDGTVARRYYLDLYPAIASLPKLGAATHGSTETGCGAGTGGPRSGPVVTPPSGPQGCRDRSRPLTSLKRGNAKISRKRVSVHGTARDRGCAGLRSVLVSVARPQKGGCRFVLANGRLSSKRGCSRWVELRARGTRSWKLQLKARLPRGTYRVRARAVDKLAHLSHVSVVSVSVR